MISSNYTDVHVATGDTWPQVNDRLTRAALQLAAMRFR